MMYTEPSTDGVGMNANIYVFGDIGDWYGSNAEQLKAELSSSEEITNIDLYISSDGGSLTETFKMYDMLRGHSANVTAHLVGVVASAATMLACAADRVVMSRQCIYMIHRAEWYAAGNADDIRKSIAVLEKLESIAVAAYTRKTGMDEEEVRSLMSEESWLEPDAALALGFVDEVVDAIEFQFEPPTDYEMKGDDWDEWYGYMKQTKNPAKLYKGAAITMLAKGYKPHQNQNNVNQLKMSKKKANGLWDRIVNKLKETGIIADDKQQEAVTMLAADESLREALKDARITEAVKMHLEENPPEASTVEPAKLEINLTELIAEATDEELDSLREKLGITAKEEEGESEAELQAEMAEMKKRISEITAQVAAGKAGKPTRPSNGGSDITNSAATDGNSKAGDYTGAQLTMIENNYRKGNLSAAMYEKMTGKKAPAKTA